MKPHQTNPLLQEATSPPAFDSIRVTDVVPGIRAIVAEVTEMLAAVESESSVSWEDVVESIERMRDRLGFAWGTVEHLMSVRNSKELREAYEEVEPDVVQLSMRIGQSQPTYRRLVALRDHAEGAPDKLDPAQQRVVAKLIEEAELSGVALEGRDLERFREIRLELAELSTRFGNQLLDATTAFALDLTTTDEVAGLPPSFLEMAAQAARAAEKSGQTPPKGRGGSRSTARATSGS